MKAWQTLIVAGGFALFALNRLPYGYYTVVRFIVSAGAAYGAYDFNRRRISWAAIAASILVLVFNLIIPVRLSRFEWKHLDLIAGVVLVALGGFAFYQQSKAQEGRT